MKFKLSIIEILIIATIIFIIANIISVIIGNGANN